MGKGNGEQSFTALLAESATALKIGSFLTEEVINGVDEVHHINEVEKKMKNDIFIDKYLLSYEKSINN